MRRLPARANRIIRRALGVLWAAVAMVPATRPVAAQEAEGGNFVRQTLAVLPFRHDADRRIGLRLADDMRGALLRAAGRRQLTVVGSDSAYRVLLAGGLQRPELATAIEVGWVARTARADESLIATVSGDGDTLVINAAIILFRDPRMREILPPVRARTRDAPEALARAVIRARTQMDALRGCENFARDGRFAAAARSAERGIAGYPGALLARTCLLRVVAAQSGRADSVIRLAETILARDTANIIAATLRAQASTAIARARGGDAAARTRGGDAAARTRAIAAWNRVLRLRPDSADLGVEAVDVLLQFSRPRDALVTLDSLTPYNRREVRYARQRFRALHTLQRWPDAAALGDSLDDADPGFRADPNYTVRYVEALVQRGDSVRAVARSARAVTEHPSEGRLYVQYVELIAGEHAVGVARGLERFPSLAPLRVLAAQRARARGDAGGEREALIDALAADGTLGPAYLRLAELWFQDGRPDSALAVLAKAPRDAEHATVLRAYLMGKGLDALRSAVDSVPASYRHALAFLALADSVNSGDDTRGLVVAAGLQHARAYLVVGAAARECAPIRAAVAELTTAEGYLARGVGQGSAATELQDAHAGLLGAASDAALVLCKETVVDTSEPPPPAR